MQARNGSASIPPTFLLVIINPHIILLLWTCENNKRGRRDGTPLSAICYDPVFFKFQKTMVWRLNSLIPLSISISCNWQDMFNFWMPQNLDRWLLPCNRVSDYSLLSSAILNPHAWFHRKSSIIEAWLDWRVVNPWFRLSPNIPISPIQTRSPPNSHWHPVPDLIYYKN